RVRELIMGRHTRWLALASAAILLGSSPAAAKDKIKTSDIFWVHPAFDSLGPQSVVLLPPSSYDKNLPNENLVGMLFAKAVQGTGYRWTPPRIAKEQIRSALGESALVAIHRNVLALGRVDSLSAPKLCRSLRAGAVMSTRV